MEKIEIHTWREKEDVESILSFIEECEEVETEGKLIEFKHYPIIDAQKEMEDGFKIKYEVTTINMSFANQNKSDIDYDPNKPSPNYDEVHKNKYIFTLEELLKFHVSLYNIAEQIVNIKPIY